MSLPRKPRTENTGYVDIGLLLHLLYVYKGYSVST